MPVEEDLLGGETIKDGENQDDERRRKMVRARTVQNQLPSDTAEDPNIKLCL